MIMTVISNGNNYIYKQMGIALQLKIKYFP